MGQERILSLRDVHMSFLDHHVLKGINLDVYAGEIIGYIGPNGAGKSTTLKILLGLLDGYEGNVELFGQNIDKHISYKRRIGYVPESADVYENLTASEYCMFVGRLYGMEINEAKEKAQQLLTLLDMGDVFHQRISSYSKGMRQKVLFVSSILHNPDLLFLDEPLSGLDANSVIVIKEILEKMCERGKTIFYSSHIMEVVENISNRIVLLVDGKIAADGSFDDLKEQSQQGSLEDIFNQLTGFDSHTETANDFVDIMTGTPGVIHD